MNLTAPELLVRKWKQTGLMEGILLKHELEYAEQLELEAKKLINSYSGRGTAPNVWPDVRRQFEQDKGIKI